MKATLLAVAAGLCWGIGELFTKSVLHTGKVGPLTAIAVRSTVALPLLWAAYVIAVHVARREPTAWPQAGAPVLAKLGLGSGLLAGGLGMICFYAALSAGEISRVKPIAFTVAPATAVCLGIVLLGEELTVRKIAAVVLILVGVVLLSGR
ncbi:MAG: EamA family transporter [Planctomycetota bacterium]|jgi:transporter family protein